MSRLTICALLAAVLTTASNGTSARAGDGFAKLRDDIHVGFWRNMCWPKPFVYPDRKAAFAPMHVMAENGWRRNNLLGAHHFKPDGTQLTTAGELRVRWILTQAPVHRRNVFVERALDAEETGRRIEAVQQFAGRVVPDAAANVLDTHIQSEGRPAHHVNWRESTVPGWHKTPEQILPEESTGPAVSN